MNILDNFDLLFVGIAMAAILILGFVVYLHDTKSKTNRAFFMLALMTIFWSVSNYLLYKLTDPSLVLWAARTAMFFAVLHTFYVFHVCYVFPKKQIKFPKWYYFALLPIVAIVASLTLTPFIFFEIAAFDAAGHVSQITNGPGIAIFGMLVFLLNIGGFSLLLRKTIRAKGDEKKQYGFILFGLSFTLLLIVVFNFVLPAFFNDARFVPFGGLFIFPFVIFTAYAIVKHKFLEVKLVSTEIITFVLSVAILLEAIASDDLITLTYRFVVFILVVCASILLIKSVRTEIQQRLQLAKLAASLKKANDRLKELDELKTEFLSIASHQLRTPLSIIKGYGELLKDGAYGKVTPQAIKILENIDTSNERLIKLVDEFLNVSRIEQGRTQFNFADMNPVTMSEEIITELKNKAQLKNINLALEVEKGIELISADEDKLRHCLYNFVDNAIKYSPELSTVRIFLEKDGEKLRARVVDEGVGLDAKDLKNLFQKFYRSPHIIKDVQGTGLGLFVVRQFVEAHGGKVIAKSKGVGKGSEFGFVIPMKQKKKEKKVDKEKIRN
jgi:signal transduction histidine kinase